MLYDGNWVLCLQGDSQVPAAVPLARHKVLWNMIFHAASVVISEGDIVNTVPYYMI